MDEERHYMLTKFPEFYELTEEEFDEGLHYCKEFQYMLVGPGMEEWEMCECFKLIQGGDCGTNNKEHKSSATVVGVRTREDESG